MSESGDNAILWWKYRLMIHRYSIFAVHILLLFSVLRSKVFIQMHSPRNESYRIFFIFPSYIYLVQATFTDPDYLFTAHNRCLWICHIVWIFQSLFLSLSISELSNIAPFHIHLFTPPKRLTSDYGINNDIFCLQSIITSTLDIRPRPFAISFQTHSMRHCHSYHTHTHF